MAFGGWRLSLHEINHTQRRYEPATMSYLAWAAVLLLAGLGLIAVEVFIPSGGLLGFLAAAAVIAFMSGPGTGLVFVVVTVVLLPMVIGLALRWWPHTPLGRRLFLKAPDEDDLRDEGSLRERLKTLIGATGKAKTKMLPSGAIRIDGKTIDAVSRGMPIEAGQIVRVVEVRGNRVVVVPVRQDNLSQDGDDLSRPIDSLGLDENPLA